MLFVGSEAKAKERLENFLKQHHFPGVNLSRRCFRKLSACRQETTGIGTVAFRDQGRFTGFVSKSPFGFFWFASLIIQKGTNRGPPQVGYFVDFGSPVSQSKRDFCACFFIAEICTSDPSALGFQWLKGHLCFHVAGHMSPSISWEWCFGFEPLP